MHEVDGEISMVPSDRMEDAAFLAAFAQSVAEHHCAEHGYTLGRVIEWEVRAATTDRPTITVPLYVRFSVEGVRSSPPGGRFITAGEATANGPLADGPKDLA